MMIDTDVMRAFIKGTDLMIYGAKIDTQQRTVTGLAFVMRGHTQVTVPLEWVIWEIDPASIPREG